MGESQKSSGEKNSSSADGDGEGPSVDHPPIIIAEKGDMMLVVTFENTDAVLKKDREMALRDDIDRHLLRPRVTKAYRVSIESLTKDSRYFTKLLTNTAFQEARLISSTHAELLLRGIKPGDARNEDLPRVLITDDDEATQSAGRVTVFEDLLRYVHRVPFDLTRPAMLYVITLAILADRFDCTTVASQALSVRRFQWPMARRAYLHQSHRVRKPEKLLRQEVLAAWVMGLPSQLHQTSRELIVGGSRLWGAYAADETNLAGAWWNLPNGLEEELQFRRECILNTIASVQTHFLGLYSSRERQCKLGYDTSSACDSFQLGQMLKFLLSKRLAHLVDFSPAAAEKFPDLSLVDINKLLSTLRACPNYQLDRHHMNCGLRTRIEPILDFIEAMLNTNVVPLSLEIWQLWPKERSWRSMTRCADAAAKDQGGNDAAKQVFAFTTYLQKLRQKYDLNPSEIALSLFTADAWDWTSET